MLNICQCIIILIISFFCLSKGSAMNIEKFIIKPGYNVNVVSGEILVKFKSYVSDSKKVELNKKYNLSKISELDLTLKERYIIEKIKLPSGMSVNEGVELYRNLPEVEFVEPNYILHAFEVVPNDIYYTSQWGLSKIHASQAWEIVTGSPTVIIAVIDTGVDYNHEDLKTNIITSNDYDFVNNDPYAMDDNGHGTHVAGIIAAVSNNGIGITGLTWNCKILPIKVLDGDGNGDDFNIAKGIQYAADNGAKIINMSFGDTNYPPVASIVISTTCQYAYEKGCILIAASGNGYDTNNDGYPDRFDCVSYPAGLDTVIAVGACDNTDNRASYSNYGINLDIVAPGGSGRNGTGENILSTIPGNKYAEEAGTSMAAPFVSGVVGLILSRNPNMSQHAIKDAICESADDIGLPGIDIYTGHGRINAFGALTWQPPPSVKNLINYPNPFNPKIGQKTFILIPEELLGTHIIVKIFNIAGDLVSILDKPGEIMSSYAKWDGKNDYGDVVSPGLYFYYIETDKGKAKGKLTVIN